MSANDVAIVGIGMHPFGRTDGVSGRQQGAVATRAALADAGIGWSDVQFAFGGSDAAGNADALVADLGLTGVEFVNVSNGCATGGSALAMADRAIRSGRLRRSASRSASTSIRRGPSTRCRPSTGWATGTARPA